jgi:hypothetical protein
MQERHKYRNLNFFSYDDKAAAKGAEAGKRTLEDWNRTLEYKEKCRYYINGVNLFELRQRKTMVNGREVIEPVKFESIAELKQFFKKHLFNLIPRGLPRYVSRKV